MYVVWGIIYYYYKKFGVILPTVFEYLIFVEPNIGSCPPITGRCKSSQEQSRGLWTLLFVDVGCGVEDLSLNAVPEDAVRKR